MRVCGLDSNQEDLHDWAGVMPISLDLVVKAVVPCEALSTTLSWTNLESLRWLTQSGTTKMTLVQSFSILFRTLQRRSRGGKAYRGVVFYSSQNESLCKSVHRNSSMLISGQCMFLKVAKRSTQNSPHCWKMACTTSECRWLSSLTLAYVEPSRCFMTREVPLCSNKLQVCRAQDLTPHCLF